MFFLTYFLKTVTTKATTMSSTHSVTTLDMWARVTLLAEIFFYWLKKDARVTQVYFKGIKKMQLEV